MAEFTELVSRLIVLVFATIMLAVWIYEAICPECQCPVSESA